MDVSVDFILDDVGKLYTKHNQERYPLSVHGDPVVETDVNRVDDYITVWPCKNDRITIKVPVEFMQLDLNLTSNYCLAKVL